MSFINQVAVVTGASDGIGLETVRLLAGAGAKVMLNARGEARLNQVIRALRATGYAPLRASLAASMRHAGAVRIDHAMGLQRLFLVPDGAKPTEGAYLHYPCRDQQLVVALESQRAQCMVVGEDLGTVAPGFREAMADAGALSYRVLYFERGWSNEVLRPQHFPRQALVTATTHDLPTLVGWWRGRDLEWRERLKLFAGESDKHSAWA
ncbi:MAG: SDR family NAD(P)-dependent oxidoreductase, partial [Verrucomicrobia bacterium]|nr:SDR family NAD(P)-dependent oxidoreductase [Verrucomicrobiota bacterium]